MATSLWEIVSMRSQNHDNMNGVKKPYIAVTCFQYLLDGFNRRDYDKNTEKGESRKERSSSMKRFLTSLVTVLLLTMALTVAASASDFDAAAKDLSAIGVFRGTEAGFELDRAPTRSEAAIMLVRLYGAEEQAAADYEAGTISHPFTDVSDFTAPYVAWLYTNGLTNGTSATTFGSAAPCSAQQYTVFLLRALGYEDGKDFDYAQAPEFAVTKGLFDTSMFGGTFLRDDLAAVTYQALAADLKDGSAYLLKSLVESGAVDARAAQPITQKIETYRALLSASSNAMNGGLDTDFDMDMQMDLALSGTDSGEPLDEQMQLGMTASGRVQMILAEEPQMAINMETTILGETMNMGEWMKDGWIYVQTEMNGETSKVKYQAEGMDAFMALYQELLDQSVSQMNGAMLPMIDSITAKTSGGNTVYTLKLNNSISGMVQDLVGMLGDALPEEVGLDMALELKDCTYTYTVSSGGRLKDCTAVVDAALTMNLDGGEEGTMAVNLGIKMDMSMDINAMGKNVRITYPDFSGFVDLTVPETSAPADSEMKTVYVTETGKRYHYDNNCNGGTYYESTLEEALSRGLTPCEKCVL